MKQQAKQNQVNQEEQIARENAAVQAALEFGTVEEMLRHDAAHTSVPDSVALRLANSVAQEPKPVRSLWKRLFGPQS